MRISLEQLQGKKPVNEKELRFLCRAHRECDLTKLDVSQVRDMSRLFQGQNDFNQDVGKWSVGNVTDTSCMFSDAHAFNQDLCNWDVANVTNMRFMFSAAHAFNYPVGDWDVANVTDMSFMFHYAESFNQRIGGWDVASVLSTTHMFNGALVFCQDIAGWDVANVTNMSFMFFRADAFDISTVGDWDFSSLMSRESMFNKESRVLMLKKAQKTKNRLKAIRANGLEALSATLVIFLFYAVFSTSASVIRLIGNDCGRDFPIDYVIYSGLFCEITDKTGGQK